MKVAIEGCLHGELEKVYDLIEKIEEIEKYKVDLLICCGDVQSTRNLEDLQCMAVPKKHLDICTFYKYYSGEKKAPILTIFIGGNHEASNYLQELPYGGWVAPNIFYLGYAGVVNVNGLRIGGVSGIYKGHDYFKGRHEFPPYDDSTMRSVYHLRHIDVFRLKQLTPDIDIMLSHDWPKNIYNYGNTQQLLKYKRHFKEDIESGRLGSPPCEDLLQKLKPKYWFSGHLHCKFSAIVYHDDDRTEMTKFLALDKCLPKRRFLQFIDFDSKSKDKLELQYDLEWLTIISLTNHLISVRSSPGYMPGPSGNERYNFTPSEEEKNIILEKFDHNLKVPDNFVRIAEPYNPDCHIDTFVEQPKAFLNPQTTEFCDKMGIDDPLRLAMVLAGQTLNHPTTTYEGKMDITKNEDDHEAIEDLLVKPRPSLLFSLPKPKFETDDSFETSFNMSSENDSTTATLDNLNLSSPQMTNELPKIAEGDDKPPIKKLKRRNQAIYTEITEED